MADITPFIKIPERYSPHPSGDVIALRADNRLYLSRFYSDGTNPIRAGKRTIDVFSQFKLTLTGVYEIALQADNGLYLSRIDRGSTDTIEAAKSSIDDFCKFKVFEYFGSTTLTGGYPIALQADNGKWLSRINRGDTDPIEAAKSYPDEYSLFIITPVLVE